MEYKAITHRSIKCKNSVLYRLCGGIQMEKKPKEENTTPSTTEKNKKYSYSLEELLSKCKPERRHEEIDFGIEGRELI